MYRYFARPHTYSTFTEEAQECHFCHVVGPGYDSPFYGIADVEFVCEPCLKSGALATESNSTNQGDQRTLRDGLTGRHPDWTEEQIAAYVAERTDELQCRTPHLVSWQDITWPAHCADYMRFEREVGRADIERFSNGSDPEAYLFAHLEPSYREHTDIADLLDSMYPGSPEESPSFDIAVYQFTCLECNEVVLLWDAS